ncbi:sulfur carrier protein ThiS [Paraperlucidibaca wandonensis]|jgi:sulfur carrier protein|uniref:Sulfur carrier protein ThiS n=1 Tax=Paraperlucidibaca wandonensis TaxID=1268273 RepID=A0ABW3HIK1_9GAMM|nr:sulfur carrier protein ThiS [Paraperlucidibaca sp.]MBQ0723523.1 sulfur carrier protein ThiS [Paraperlucidibaca sp.]MBQ0843046.1 sulfur carrier protein ThiS [Paraperlucidibaca sp.]|tara:strand:+ start:1629 stop:1829 length:201 start_codon:yes stop_codon:yes gene_type:complete
MNIRLNGESLTMSAGSTISDLLAAQDLVGKRIAVECNGEIVPRSQHSNHTLQPNDAIEIVHAIGGG